MGMRIRKAVSDGYSTAPFAASATRAPLPAHLSQPPLLVFGGSSGSLMSEWEEQAPSQPHVEVIHLGTAKRPRDEAALSLDDYQQRYGQLSFSEEF